MESSYLNANQGDWVEQSIDIENSNDIKYVSMCFANVTESKYINYARYFGIRFHNSTKDIITETNFSNPIAQHNPCYWLPLKEIPDG